jgi:hypothetical protein
MGTELRQSLAGYLGHRVKIRGTLDEVRADHQGRRACVVQPELDGEVVCSYVWVLNITDDWFDKEGGEVVFDAVVRDYNNGGGRNYCLRNPGNLQVLAPPAIRTPEKADLTARLIHLPPQENLLPPNHCRDHLSAQDDPGAIGVGCVRKARAFAKVCGSPDRALEIIDKLPDMAVPVLKEYLSVLSESD